MLTWLRWLWCRVGRHEGYVDGGFHCSYCPFEIPYELNDAAIDRAITAARDIKLGDDIKAAWPEQWQQDAILQAWRTGKPAVGKPPAKEPEP